MCKNTREPATLAPGDTNKCKINYVNLRFNVCATSVARRIFRLRRERERGILRNSKTRRFARTCATRAFPLSAVWMKENRGNRERSTSRRKYCA